jgi:ABC-type polysaccharide/polyol phosphate export permease
MVASLLQVAFFGSPILWPATTVGQNSLIVQMNPIYHLLEIVRAPLLGESPTWLSWCVSLSSIVVGTLAAMLLFHRTCHRIVYWI